MEFMRIFLRDPKPFNNHHIDRGSQALAEFSEVQMPETTLKI